MIDDKYYSHSYPPLYCSECGTEFEGADARCDCDRGIDWELVILCGMGSLCLLSLIIKTVIVIYQIGSII